MQCHMLRRIDDRQSNLYCCQSSVRFTNLLSPTRPVRPGRPSSSRNQVVLSFINPILQDRGGGAVRNYTLICIWTCAHGSRCGTVLRFEPTQTDSKRNVAASDVRTPEARMYSEHSAIGRGLCAHRRSGAGTLDYRVSEEQATPDTLVQEGRFLGCGAHGRGT